MSDRPGVLCAAVFWIALLLGHLARSELSRVFGAILGALTAFVAA
jgi:hypothetical protein